MRGFSISVCVLLLILPTTRAADTPLDFFEKEVRPMLVEKCQRCHGPTKQQHGLRLDSRSAILKGGDAGPALVPEKPDASLLIRAIERKGELKMPPDKPLSANQIAALKHWVALGAPWPQEVAPRVAVVAKHWAFEPVRHVEPPVVPGASTPIDRFIRDRLAKEKLSFAPPADPRALIRRATFAVTGLPPTAAEIDAFAKNPTAAAYEQLVDRLLASPRYGEQWGRHWLDVARYSDSKGYVYAREERFWLHAWTYRDWVVKSLNSDLPYDRFLKLQLAADTLAPQDREAQAAMGYLTLGRRYLGVTHDIIDDRIDVVTRGMLALTVACARCHDHKFDPIPTENYYSLYGIFRSCQEVLVPLNRGNDTRTFAEFQKGYAALQQKYNLEVEKQNAIAAERLRQRVTEYMLAQLEMHKYPEEGFDTVIQVTDLVPESVRRWRSYLGETKRRNDPVFAAWHAFAAVPKAEFARKASLIREQLDGTNPRVLERFTTPPTDMQEVVRRYGQLFHDIDKRWQESLKQAKTAKQPEPTRMPDPADEAVRQVLYGSESPCKIPAESLVNTEYYYTSKALGQLWAIRKEMDRFVLNSPAEPAFALILADRPVPVESPVFRRGNPAMPVGAVPHHFLTALSVKNAKNFTQGSGRLELAERIASPDNPLTARVMVNRVWMHYFGAGLVRTPSDFGTRAEPPSHPELLDYLADQFVKDGWSLKKLHRQILLSQTFQQSSVATKEQLERDPENRLLSHMTPRRLSFEELRDSLFAMTGDLDPKMGGRPVNLFAQPPIPRRTIYGEVDREYFPSLLRAFDVANPDLHIPQRSETTVPQQALFFLNHPLMLNRAKSLATSVSALPTAEKVRVMYRRALLRDPRPEEMQLSLALLDAAKAEGQSTPVQVPEWSYGVGTYSPDTGRVTKFQPLPHFAGDSWQGGPSWPDTKLGWARITATGGHPGNDLAHAIVRRWTAPRDAVIAVQSEVHHPSPMGDGIRASIVSSRTGLIATTSVHNQKLNFPVRAIEVKKGESIDFVVDIRGNLGYDDHFWSPQIVETPTGGKPTTWNAKAQFGGKITTLAPWEQLAQVLLMSNEFTFVD